MARGSTESPIRGVRHASCSVVRATLVSLGCGMAVRALKNSSHVVLARITSFGEWSRLIGCGRFRHSRCGTVKLGCASSGLNDGRLRLSCTPAVLGVGPYRPWGS